jgi:hypothetical protein
LGRPALSSRDLYAHPAGLFIAAAIAALLGCTSTLGGRPNLEALGSLRRGESGAPEIVLAIGEPTGRGEWQFDPGSAPREVWAYEFSEIHKLSGESDVLMLLVLLKDGRYDGHLAFGGHFEFGSR